MTFAIKSRKTTSLVQPAEPKLYLAGIATACNWDCINGAPGLCVDHDCGRGRHKSEVKLPNLEADLRSLVERQAQADLKLQSTFAYARISARAVREVLINEKGYTDAELRNRQTIGSILNHMGYRLKYCPSYHSKYNPIERCWAALENYWDGAIPDSVEAAVQ